ncbi:sodium:solute symporter [bacterium]|nr:sodium:solute symporter [bacterium]
MTIKLVVLALYAAMIVFMGVRAMRGTQSFNDFFLGGGKIGPWMTAFTYGTAYFSAVVFIGFAGKVGWGFGFSGLWVALGNSLVGVLAVWWFMGPRIRAMVQHYGVHTMGEFFEVRYESRFLKLFGALSVFVFFIPYTAAVFMGLSYLFESIFNVPYWVALVGMGGFTALYLVLGGYKAMTMIDMAFGMIMTVGVIVLVVATLDAGDGLAGIARTLSAQDPRLTGPVGPPGWWPLVSLVFLTSVAPFGMPQLVQKFYAIRDERSIRIGMWASTAFALLIGGVAYFVGASTRALLSTGNAPAAFTADGAPVFDRLMPELLDKVMPDSLVILLLLVLLSASMSTLAALVLVSSSAVVKDFYAGFVRRGASDRWLTLLMRLSSATFVALSVVLALARPATIVTILGISWGAIGSVFIGPFVWGLCWRRMHRIGAITGAVVALTVCLGLYFAGWSSPQAGTIGMLVSLGLSPLVSLVVPRTARPVQ